MKFQMDTFCPLNVFALTYVASILFKVLASLYLSLAPLGDLILCAKYNIINASDDGKDCSPLKPLVKSCVSELLVGKKSDSCSILIIKLQIWGNYIGPDEAASRMLNISGADTDRPQFLNENQFLSLLYYASYKRNLGDIKNYNRVVQLLKSSH